jgi:hypothetical protein
MKGWVLVVMAALGAMAPPAHGLDIFQAVTQDSMHLIKKALKSGADIDAKEAGSGQTPLSNNI